MNRQKKQKKFSPMARTIAFLSSFLLIGCVVFILISGFSFISGFLLAASMIGIAGPSVASGEGFLEIIAGVFELIGEVIQSIFEMIVDVISSIFG